MREEERQPVEEAETEAVTAEVPAKEDSGEAAAEESALPRAEERIRELEEELRRTKAESALRERRLCCIRHLQDRGIREELAELVVSPGDAELAEEDLLRRIDLLAEAVEEAAVRQLRSRAVSMTPRTGGQAPLTGAFIRETPVARLAEMMGK